jgi:hypothetical protein
MYGAKEQRASTDTASLRSMARLSAYAKVADGAERPPSVVAAGVLISDSVSGVERLQPLVEASSQRAFRLQLLLEGPARGAAVGLLLLTFWEIPRWCRADGRCECVWDVDDPSRCPYPTFDIAYVDEYVAVWHSNLQPDFNVREQSIRPKISRIDVDVTELENSEVWSGPTQTSD